MSIDVSTEQGVLTLTLNRPDKKNALNKLMYQQLVQQLQQAAKNDDVKVVLLQGSAECFSSGNDLADFLQSGELNDTHPTVMFLYEMAKFPKPVVAAVAGLAATAAAVTGPDKSSWPAARCHLGGNDCWHSCAGNQLIYYYLGTGPLIY